MPIYEETVIILIKTPLLILTEIRSGNSYG
nr:MAG TPA: hypothetical protein [Bacteriophage sp.]